jgi:hypothetical protein
MATRDSNFRNGTRHSLYLHDGNEILSPPVVYLPVCTTTLLFGSKAWGTQ